MLIAFVIWLMAKFGVTVSPERVRELDAEFYDRPALVNVHFGRVLNPGGADLRILGIGYERHLGTQRYVGFGFLADALLPRGGDQNGKADFMIGTQLYVHPIKPLEITYAIGAYWHDGSLAPLNRFGVGYRVMTLHFAPVPSFWFDLVGKDPRYVLGCQIEF
jgi:hypothetical protein